MDDRGEARQRYQDPDLHEQREQTKEQDWRENTLRPSAVFGRRLQETRKARNLTQAELARQMRAKGHAMSKTALLRIERSDRRLTLDEAFALTEALQAVPVNMLTPPEGKFVRLSESLATDGSGIRKWLIKGLPGRSNQDPLPELTDDVRSEEFEHNLARLARALDDAMRIGGGDGKAARIAAVRAIREEVLRQERERAHPAQTG